MKTFFKKIYYIFLTLSKYFGLFEIAKFLTSNHLRILCYHNFSSGDFVIWSPSLHITPETFKKRIEYIAKGRFTILSLWRGIEVIKDDNRQIKLPLVVTIDDGWAAILKSAHPILQLAKVPYTVYVTSWYSINNMPIFNLVVPYVLWKAKKNSFDFKGIDIPIKFDDYDVDNIVSLAKKIVEFGERQLSLVERYDFLKSLCKKIGVNYSKLEFEKNLTLLSEPELEKLCADGVDLQLHTHTHTWPLDEKLANSELKKNRAYLEKIAKKSLVHFCYPSGIWDSRQFAFLKKNMIESATTCNRGLNNGQTNVYALNRFLDSEEIPQIVFEAEVSGFLHLLEKIGLSKIKSYFCGIMNLFV